MNTKIDSLVLVSYAANCYLLWKNRHVLIVDPGSKSPLSLIHI